MHYRVVFEGRLVQGKTLAGVREAFTKKFGEKAARSVFARSRVVLKKGLEKEQAERWRDTFLELGFVEVSSDQPDIDRVLAWADAGDPVARVAREIQDGTARLVGIGNGEDVEFTGVRAPFECHTKRADFRLELDPEVLSAEQRDGLAAGTEFIERYNDLLATYWEYDIANCTD